MAAFDCHLEVPPHPQNPSTDFTVGREFVLTCMGPFPAFTGDPSSWHFELTPEQSHDLKIFEVRKPGSDTLEIHGTSYTVGKHDFKNLVLTDGTTKAELGPLQFEVQSVLDPQQPQQEPYGAIGAMSIPIPLLWWILMLAVFIFLASTVGIFLRHRWQQKKLRERMKEHDSALTPLVEFHQNLRRLRRQNDLFTTLQASPTESAGVVRELEKFFRVFVLRRFQVPALEWGDRTLLRVLTRTHPAMMEEKGKEFSGLLKEFASARAPSAKVQAQDALQLADQSRMIAEFLDAKGGKNG